MKLDIIYSYVQSCRKIYLFDTKFALMGKHLSRIKVITVDNHSLVAMSLLNSPDILRGYG